MPSCPCPDVDKYDYYWRDFYGIVPEDALPAGKLASGETVYVGQVYGHNMGLLTCTLRHGVTEFEYLGNGTPHKATKFVKILCTKHPQNFSWLRTSNTTFHTDVTDKHAVVAGHNGKVEHGHKVCRITHEGNVVIGQNASAYVGNAYSNYALEGKGYDLINNYEVLIYNQSPEVTFDVRAGPQKQEEGQVKSTRVY